MEFKWIHYNYSMKNIPMLSEKLHKTTLTNKMELLIKRMRWKGHLTDSSYAGHANPLFYIFKSRKCPLQHKRLKDFENGLLELVKNGIEQLPWSAEQRYKVRVLKNITKEVGLTFWGKPFKDSFTFIRLDRFRIRKDSIHHVIWKKQYKYTMNAI